MALKDDLAEVLPRDAVRYVPRRYQVIGDVAILSLPAEISRFGSDIARVLISRSRNIRTVLAGKSMTGGDVRTREYEVLEGNSTVTECREFGHRYRLDVARVFYSSRLASERNRIGLLVGPEERVMVPFCGVGPFAIPPAARGARVTAVEKNPEACRWLRENVRLNGVEENLTLIEGDVDEVIPALGSGYDRAVVPAPYGRDDTLGMICRSVREGGAIHFYTFGPIDAIAKFRDDFETLGLSIVSFRRCGHVAPGISRWVFDLEKQPA